MNIIQVTIISTAVGKNPLEEMEENNRMGKTRDLFKKIRDIKGIFHAKMGSIKDRNGMDLTEAEDIKKKWSSHHSPQKSPKMQYLDAISKMTK